ncbi:FadR/GntR family transcriptional regulator [Phytoactinopolyspora endophytica]|uniref:FadR/GntR family transcriptional regulator n=1 Tax=Phytoactinopolyspora endophytica TaxID=1642495 RepID=UPI00101DAA75|nr:FadR/GntR family transcriptional regulator [Phytoactinopolyspora endophytica]
MAVYQRRGLHGEVVHELAQRILSGRYAEGSGLDLGAIGEEFDVSRTVVREALKVLAAKGLVDARQKRGTYVRDRGSWNLLDADVIGWQLKGKNDLAFLDDLAEVRSIVEPASARFAAERRTVEDLERLDAALDAMAEAFQDGDADGHIEADLAFHHALLTATHNELLQRMEMVIEVGLAERDELVHARPSVPDPTPSHRAVLEAVRAQRPGTAEAAMRDLLDEAVRDAKALTGYLHSSGRGQRS